MSDWTSPSGEARILHGTCQARLRELPENSIHCCVTSPPYWGLRDYGHDDQIGLESCVEEYVERMVAVFREVWRVLRNDGTLWLNLGDCYASSICGGDTTGTSTLDGSRDHQEASKKAKRSFRRDRAVVGGVSHRPVNGLRPKQLVGVPWRVAFALQADGWYLRQDLIWSKPNPMPESVRDRCTKSHEYIFLLTKSPRYFYDAEAIKTRARPKTLSVTTTPRKGDGTESAGEKVNAWMEANGGRYIPSHANRRSVWTISSRPYKGAHFAVFPPELVTPCVLAGTSAYGACATCGAPIVRVTEKTTRMHAANGKAGSSKGRTAAGTHGATSLLVDGRHATTRTVGWKPSCRCDGTDIRPAVVLDPFSGSGTTAEVCLKYGRQFLGCEISGEYIELAKQRVLAAEKRFGTPLFKQGQAEAAGVESGMPAEKGVPHAE